MINTQVSACTPTYDCGLVLPSPLPIMATIRQRWPAPQEDRTSRQSAHSAAVHGGQEELPAFESARVESLRESTSFRKYAALRKGLAVRFQWLRGTLLITLTACCAFYLLAVGTRLHSGHDGKLTTWHLLRLGLVALVFPLVLSVIAASFPTDSGLATPSGQMLSQPIACINFANAAVYGVTSTWRCLQLQASANISALSAFVHITFYVTFQLNWFVHVWLLRTGQRSPWGITRVALFMDGLLFIVAALALRGLGTTIGYPPLAIPGNTFKGAILRGAATLPLGLLFSPGTRRRISESAHRVGWNHVRVTLDQAIDFGRRSDDENSSCYDSTSDGPVRRAASHHTAKVGGPFMVLANVDSPHSDSESQ